MPCVTEAPVRSWQRRTGNLAGRDRLPCTTTVYGLLAAGEIRSVAIDLTHSSPRRAHAV